MRQAFGGTRSLPAAMLAFGMTLAGMCVAQEPTAADFIVPTTGPTVR